MWLRAYRAEDCAATAQVYFRGVREGAANAYSDAQRAAWAPAVPDPEIWQARLDGQQIFVAERDRAVVGFMTLRRDGYLDFAYVLPEEQGRGTADGLYAMVVNAARTAQLTRLTTEASYLARRFFAKHGWQVERAQSVERKGVSLTNFAMSLDLS